MLLTRWRGIIERSCHFFLPAPWTLPTWLGGHIDAYLVSAAQDRGVPAVARLRIQEQLQCRGALFSRHGMAGGGGARASWVFLVLLVRRRHRRPRAAPSGAAR